MKVYYKNKLEEMSKQKSKIQTLLTKTEQWKPYEGRVYRKRWSIWHLFNFGDSPRKKAPMILISPGLFHGYLWVLQTKLHLESQIKKCNCVDALFRKIGVSLAGGWVWPVCKNQRGWVWQFKLFLTKIDNIHISALQLSQLRSILPDTTLKNIAKPH